jgi:hypothetical protein
VRAALAGDGLEDEAVAAPGCGVKAPLTGSGPKRVVETPEYAAFARRILRACARRVAEGDVEGLACLVALRTELETAIASAVAGLRSEQWSYSWAQVAAVLGSTRQAAQQRYGA